MRHDFACRLVVAFHRTPLDVDTGRDHQAVVLKHGSARQADGFRRRVDTRGAAVHHIDAVRVFQGIKAVGDVVHVVKTAQDRVAEGTGDELFVPLDECDLQSGRHPAQVLGTTGSTKTTTNDDDTAAGIIARHADGRPAQQ